MMLNQAQIDALVIAGTATIKDAVFNNIRRTSAPNATSLNAETASTISGTPMNGKPIPVLFVLINDNDQPGYFEIVSNNAAGKPMMTAQASDVTLPDGTTLDKIEIPLASSYKLPETWGGVWDDIFQPENRKYSGAGNGWIKLSRITGEPLEMSYSSDPEKVSRDAGSLGSIKGAGEILAKDDVSVTVRCYFSAWEALLS